MWRTFQLELASTVTAAPFARRVSCTTPYQPAAQVKFTSLTFQRHLPHFRDRQDHQAAICYRRPLILAQQD